MFLYTDHQALEPLIKRNRCNKQYSARLTRWLDRFAHFDISIQHTGGSNLKFPDFLSRNPVKGATAENKNDEQNVINILTEQAELNLKYGRIFTNQSQQTPKKNYTRAQIEQPIRNELNIRDETTRQQNKRTRGNQSKQKRSNVKQNYHYVTVKSYHYPHPKK